MIKKIGELGGEDILSFYHHTVEAEAGELSKQTGRPLEDCIDDIIGSAARCASAMMGLNNFVNKNALNERMD